MRKFLITPKFEKWIILKNKKSFIYFSGNIGQIHIKIAKFLGVNRSFQCKQNIAFAVSAKHNAV